MTDNSQNSRVRFFLMWILMTSAGYSVGFLLGFAMGHLLLGNAMIGVGVGLGVGFFQWLVLRKLAPVSALWIVANVLGLAGALGLHGIITGLSGFPGDLGWPVGALGWALAFAVGGTLTGYLQARLLTTIVRPPSVWIVACGVGWSLSVCGLAIPPDMTGGYEGLWLLLLLFRNGMLAPAMAGLILGTIGAATIATRLNATRSESSVPAPASSSKMATP